MSKVVVVIGAGVSGQLSAYSVKKNFPDYKVVLVGPEDSSESRPGLFYLSQRVDGLCLNQIPVSYDKIGDGTFEDYQRKSRGSEYSRKTISTSSFDLIGKTVDGFILRKPADLSGVLRIYENVKKVDYDSQIVVPDCGVAIKYDYVIVTTPLQITTQIDSCGCKFSVSRSDFKSLPVYQKVTGIENFDIELVDKINVFYDLSKSSDFYRHSSYYFKGTIVKMISESIIPIEDYSSILYPGKIVPNKDLTDYVNFVENFYGNVLYCGRYSRWDYHYLAEQSYFDTLKFLSKD